MNYILLVGIKPMKPKIILHCGAPKTGSTSFQHLLYANIDRLAKAGFYCPSVSRKRRVKDDIRIMLGSILRPEHNNQSFVYRIREVLAEIHAETGAHTLIISNENMLGKPFANRHASFYERANETAQRLWMTLDDYDVDVRFVVRDYAKFLPSWYVQSVRMGSRVKFDNFQKVYDLDSVTWKTPVQALRQHFGNEKVEIYDHADLVRDSHAFLSAMFPEIMAVLGDRGRQLPNKNISIGGGMVEVYRRWNEIAGFIAPNVASLKVIRHIGRRYALLPFERFSKSEKLVLPPELAAQLSERYRADIAAINPLRVGVEDADAPRYAAG